MLCLNVIGETKLKIASNFVEKKLCYQFFIRFLGFLICPTYLFFDNRISVINLVLQAKFGQVWQAWASQGRLDRPWRKKTGGNIPKS